MERCSPARREHRCRIGLHAVLHETFALLPCIAFCCVTIKMHNLFLDEPLMLCGRGGGKQTTSSSQTMFDHPPGYYIINHPIAVEFFMKPQRHCAACIRQDGYSIDPPILLPSSLVHSTWCVAHCARPACRRQYQMPKTMQREEISSTLQCLRC